MYRIGVDLGGTNIAVGVIDENYKIYERKNLLDSSNCGVASFGGM